MTVQMTYVIGIDGGATKTVFALCGADGAIVRTRQTGSCNPNDVGFAQCEQELLRGISELLGGVPHSEVRACFAGISGVETDQYHIRVECALREAFPAMGQIVCQNDALNPLYGGLGEGDGCAVISGTGMVCYARVNGELHRTGGWGPLFDRAGSGYDLGCDALTAVYRAHDGLGPQTALTALIEDMLGESAKAALGRFYRGKRALVASFAPAVFAAVRMGDEVARGILERNMEGLALHINHAARYFDGAYDVIVTGGVFHNAEALDALLRYTSPQAHITVYDRMPAFGAVRRALLLAGIREVDIHEPAAV